EQKEIEKKTAVEKTTAKKEPAKANVKVTFIVRFHTKVGQSLYITGNHSIFGSMDPDQALLMQCLSEDVWMIALDLNIAVIPVEGIIYNYLLKNEDGSLSFDWGSDKILTPDLFMSEETL